MSRNHRTRATRGALAALIASALLFAAGACGTSNTTQVEQPDSQTKTQEKTGAITVVASINQWGSLAEEIGGDDVKVTSVLSSTGVDAHDFEPKTSDLAALSKAEIVVANGAGYDTWATKSRASDSTLVSAAQIVGAMDGDNPHLWFSKDARSGMAKELADAFSKARPKKKAEFAKRLKAWQAEEDDLDAAMTKFAKAHPNASYAATEAVVYYLMSDMSFEDVTPRGYEQAVANGGEIAPADLQTFQKLVEDKKLDVLINNTQEATDATNMLTGAAGRADVPVVDVSEQMPDKYDTLDDWIEDLTERIFTAVDPEYDDDSNDGQTDPDAPADGQDQSGEQSSQDQSDGSATTGCSNGDGTGDCTGGDDGSNAGQQDPGK
ncbi:ABC transporter substrate-binding protein [Bifidobacterium sp. UTCIF-37]|uniref:metal ABC transporter solute-binding protein, Zn/Mn family n=1 Tax=unclassified Bifidobacterium TaxID=2608897 RepID=UPI00112E4E06|nr:MULTISPECIES: zinc ABC transporter substrate-binding protein [unclassified Bifidobacterium]TPF87201.1 ABC transporter substrate-binding protein [Bifidobacterium sp. UTCIF-37]TPF91306.1 ABC transporter substrate-binding protein [Bifidobacterium sp. UTCIF-38]